MPHKISEEETFAIKYHFNPYFPDARYDAWEVAREASIQRVSFDRDVRRRLLGVMRKESRM